MPALTLATSQVDDTTTAIHCMVGDEAITLWDASWAPTTNAKGKLKYLPEADVQAALQKMAPGRPFLNEKGTAHEGLLYWDFEIHETPTLGKLKPDGHGRLRASVAYRNCNPLHAVLVEAKTGKTISSEGRGMSIAEQLALRRPTALNRPSSDVLPEDPCQ